ncbi:GNAT family N-acetyltransferase [Microbispora sp. ATCC PTA-5024]|uniref:GNAT family N-acetyltransferase n=1 Tax=Microbispora sp. ATCC PTA-5024 TaxID=316330 RepID=UPI00040E3C69|nr:GNAT family N-acetyltransferase [Microbispora sp. ATCC PTA-5024]
MIRWARSEDLPRLAEVERAADGMFEPLGIVFPPGTTMIEECDDPGRVIVAGDPPVGFALIGEVDGLTHLEQLAVRPECQGRGIGTQLLHAVCDAAAAVTAAVTLTTFRDVPWNAPWYARRGFAVLPPELWGPELAALVERERAMGIELAPRVVMRRDVRADPATEDARTGL